MVKKIDPRDIRDAQQAGDKKIKNISTVTQVVTERANKEAARATKYLDDKVSNKSSISSIDRVLKNLADATSTLTSGMRYITAETAKGVKSITYGGAQAVNEYAKAVSQDINVNKQALMVTTIGKISPIVGYSVAKLMETTVFKNMISRMKEGLGKALSSVSSRFKKLAGAGWEKFKSILPFRSKEAKALKEKVPKMASGGFVKKGGMAEIHAAEVVSPVNKIVGTIVDQVEKRTSFLHSGEKLKQQKLLVKEAITDSLQELQGKRPVLERIADNTFQTRQAIAPIGGVMGFFKMVLGNVVSRLGPFTRFFLYSLRTLQRTIMFPLRFMLRKRGGALRPTGNMVKDMMMSSFSQQNLLADYLPAIASNTNDTANAVVGLFSHVSGQNLRREDMEKKRSWSIAGVLAKTAYKGTVGLAAKGAGALAKQLLPEKLAETLTKERTIKGEIQRGKEKALEGGRRLGGVASRAGKSVLRRLGWKERPQDIREEEEAKRAGRGLPLTRASRVSPRLLKKLSTIIDLLRSLNRINARSSRFQRRRARRAADTTGFLMKMIIPIGGMILPIVMKLGGLLSGGIGGLFKAVGGGGKLLLNVFKAIPKGALASVLGPALGLAAAGGIGYMIGKPIGDAINKRLKEKWVEDSKKRQSIEAKMAPQESARFKALTSKEGSIDEKVQAAHATKMTTSLKLEFSKQRESKIGMWASTSDMMAIDTAQKEFMSNHMDEYLSYGFVTVNAARHKFLDRGGFRGIGAFEDPLEYGKKREQAFFNFLRKTNEGNRKTEAELYAEVGAEGFRRRSKYARVELSEQTKNRIESGMLRTGELTEKVTAYLGFPINLLGMLTNEVLMNHPRDIIRASELVLTSGKYTKNMVGEGIWKAAQLVKNKKKRLIAWAEMKDKAQQAGLNSLSGLGALYGKVSGGFSGLIKSAQEGMAGGGILWNPAVAVTSSGRKIALAENGPEIVLPLPPELAERLSGFRIDKGAVASMGINKEMGMYERLNRGFDNLAGAVISGSQAASSVVTSFVDSSQKSAQVQNSNSGNESRSKFYYDDSVDSILRGRIT